jgi:hypothetical protein
MKQNKPSKKPINKANKLGIKPSDRVDKLILSELWPIAKSLEIQTKSGVVLKRDKDGSVLNLMRQKALELIQMYLEPKSREDHTKLVESATSYQDVIKLMTNVFMHHTGSKVL